QRSGSCSWSSSASAVSKAPRCRYSATTSEAVNGGSRQAGEEEFIDHAGTRDTNRALLFAGWMGRDHHATLDAIRPHRHIRAVVERAHHSTLRVGQMLIGGQFQASLDLGSLQDLIVTATHHKRQPSQIGKDGSCAVLPIEAKKGTRIGMLVRFEVALDRCHCPTQLCPVFTIPRISISAEPLMGMGLQDRSASSHDFPALAPGVAGGTQRTQAPLSSRPIWSLGQGPLAGCLARPINIEDQPLSPCSICQPACLLFFLQRASEQIFKKKRAQSFNRSLIERGEKTRERRAGWQAVASEQGHERAFPGLETLVKAFQRSLTADRIAEEHREKIDHLIAPEAATGKAHLL